MLSFPLNKELRFGGDINQGPTIAPSWVTSAPAKRRAAQEVDRSYGRLLCAPEAAPRLPRRPASGIRDVSLDHLVVAGNERWQHFEAERLRCLKIEHKFDLRRLLHWEVGRLFALENPACVDAGKTISVRKVSPVAH